MREVTIEMKFQKDDGQGRGWIPNIKFNFGYKYEGCYRSYIVGYSIFNVDDDYYSNDGYISNVCIDSVQLWMSFINTLETNKQLKLKFCI